VIMTFFEEWEFENFAKNFSQIKQLIDRVGFSVDVKYGNPRKVKIRHPIIFSSNSAPHSDPAFVRRVAVVDAVAKLEDAPKVRVPKEVDENEEVELVEIPSSDSEYEEEMECQKGNFSTIASTSSRKVAILEKRILGHSNHSESSAL
jgi:hypothetical protein